MDSQKILYNKVGNDESYTPAYGVKPILKHILQFAKTGGYSVQKPLVVWCPFDTSESEYVKLISTIDKRVVVEMSHIDDGQDFFEYEPEEWDIIVSNPPFKNKRLFFERALRFRKPFALLMTNAWLNDKYSKWVFKEANMPMELLMFDKRIHFEQNGTTKKSTTFSSSYFCSGFLAEQITLEELTYE